MTSYESLPGFEQVYLEDSFVLDIEVHPGVVRIPLEIVLTEQHPYFTQPLPNEQYCYRAGQIEFTGVRRLQWIVPEPLRPAVDANDEIDYGGIDTLEVENGGYVLSGDFGQLRIVARECALRLDE